MKRNGEVHVTTMTKYIVSPRELQCICDFLSENGNERFREILTAIHRTVKGYERKYKTDPMVSSECRMFILFPKEAEYFQKHCIDLLFHSLKEKP